MRPELGDEDQVARRHVALPHHRRAVGHWPRPAPAIALTALTALATAPATAPATARLIALTAVVTREEVEEEAGAELSGESSE